MNPSKLGNVHRNIFEKKRLSNAEIDRIRLEVNAGASDKTEEEINEGNASKNNQTSSVVDQPVVDQPAMR